MCIGFGIGTNHLRSALVPSLSFDWLNTNSLVSLEGYPLTFTRASQATYWGSDGLLKTALNNEARFEYDPVSLVKRGLKIEPQATNLCLYSETYSNSFWSKTNMSPTVTNETVSIRGLNNDCFKIQEDATGTPSLASTPVTIVSGNRYCAYFIIKRGGASLDWVRIGLLDDSSAQNGGRAWFNINNGTVGSIQTSNAGSNIQSGIIPIRNGFYLCFISGNVSTSTTIYSFICSATANLSLTRVSSAYYYLNGTQIELGQYPTSYIPTTTANITRSPDLPTIALGSWYNANEGSIVSDLLHYGIVQPSVRQFVFGVDNDTSNNRFAMSFNGTEFFLVSDNVTQVSLPSALYPSNMTRYKVSCGFKQNDFFMGINNSQIGVSSAGNMPSSVTRLRIGTDVANRFANGCFASFKYYNKKFTNGTLQALTA